MAKVTLKSLPKRINPSPMLTREQAFLGQLFGGGDKVIFGSKNSESLPRLNKVLISGNGLIKSGDTDRETAQCFGF